MPDRSVTDYTKDGKCSNCGACCNDLIPISADEVARIKWYIKQHGIKEQRHNVAAGVDVTCPFRDEANRCCTIYPVRPLICRQFKCDNPTEDIQLIKRSLMRKNGPTNMRRIFYGNEEVSDFFLALGRIMVVREVKIDE